MTTPTPDQPPTVPMPPYQPGPPVSPPGAMPGPYPPPPAGYGPPMPPPRYGPVPPAAKKRSFWGSTGGILTIVFGSLALVGLVCGGLVIIGVVGDRSAASKIEVTLTKCEFSRTEVLPSVTVGYTAHNTGSTARSARIELEFRDASGARIDTDTAYTKAIPAGDTIRGEEVTLLDAPPTGTGECRVVAVR